MLSAATKSESLATMLGGLAIIDFALYTGYVIPRPSMVVWWKWLSYCNPVAFAFEILLTNEFRTLNVPCANFIPAGQAYQLSIRHPDGSTQQLDISEQMFRQNEPRSILIDPTRPCPDIQLRQDSRHLLGSPRLEQGERR